MFKPFKDNPNYLIYDDGKIYSLYSNRFLTPELDKDGYLRVGLSINKKNKMFRVHRLVALTFIPNPNNYQTVNHKDENKLNNKVSNLEWLSLQDNLDYGTGRKRAGLSKRGEKNGRSKKIKQYDKQGNLLNVFSSGADAALSLNKYPQGVKNINACANGRLHTAYGYVWRFEVNPS